MCAGCAMAAAAGASGVRTWLQTRHLTWLTPRRMRAATIALVVVALAIPSIGLGGSTKPPHPQAKPIGTQNSDYDVATCNHADGCSGSLDVSGHMFVKLVR
jgi:hypothetical protein